METEETTILTSLRDLTIKEKPETDLDRREKVETHLITKENKRDLTREDRTKEMVREEASLTRLKMNLTITIIAMKKTTTTAMKPDTETRDRTTGCRTGIWTCLKISWTSLSSRSGKLFFLSATCRTVYPETEDITSKLTLTASLTSSTCSNPWELLRESLVLRNFWVLSA